MTCNLLADPRASLLVHESGNADPLANGRVTLVGRCQQLPRGDCDARTAYLHAHPGAAYYVDFEDFAFWRLGLEAVRYIGGYGRMSWVGAEDFHRATPDPLAASADRILSHMNEDHADALRKYALAFTRAHDALCSGLQRLRTARASVSFERFAVNTHGDRTHAKRHPGRRVPASPARYSCRRDRSHTNGFLPSS